MMMMIPCLEQVLGQRGAEVIWECAEQSWDVWDELTRAEISWGDVRRGEKRREDIRWADMSCGELRRVEKSCEIWEKPRRDEKRWEKFRWLRREENSCDQWQDVRWDELRWDGMTQTAMTMGSNEQFPREAAMRWDQAHEKRSSIRKAWHQIDKSRACSHEAQEACLSPIGTAFAPLYRL